MMHRRIFVDDVFIDVGSWQTGVRREGLISVRLDAQSEHIPAGRMHLKAAIGACGNDPDRVLRSVTPHVAIANPAFAPDSWRIQVDRVAGPARAPTKCSCITPMLDTHARAGGWSDHRYERSFLCHHGPPTGRPTLTICVESFCTPQESSSMRRFSADLARATVRRDARSALGASRGEITRGCRRGST